MSNYLNRMANATNPFQGDAKKVLCVCSAGLLRSPTAAHALSKEYGYNTRAVGHSQEYALVPVDLVHIVWADEILCVEDSVLQEMNRQFGDDARYISTDKICLGIPDKYPYGDDELVRLILKQYSDAMMLIGVKENSNHE